jgi:hypothetical protein
VVIDSDENVIMVGTTSSPGFPVNIGPAFAGVQDIFVVKFGFGNHI